MGEEYSNYEECRKSSANKEEPEKKMSLPELGVKAFKILEKTLAVQTDTADALNHHFETVTKPNDMSNLYNFMSYILTLAEANCDAAKIIRDTIG